jgi:hypothetical protein
MKMTKKATILFVFYGGGHVASCLPVADLLRRQGYRVQLVALTTARDYVIDRGWKPLGFKDFLDPSDTVALYHGQKLLSREANGLVAKEESVAYLGLNYKDLVGAAGEQGAALIYAEKGRQAFFPVRTLRLILEKVNPNLLITTCSPRSELAALYAAADLNVPTLCMLDLPDIHMVARAATVPRLHAICVAHMVTRDMLIKRGLPSRIIHVTGNPAFDQLDQVMEDDIRRFRDGLNAGPDKKILVWASQPEPIKHPINGKISNTELPLRIENTLRSWIKTRSDIRLIVRHHPNESRDFIPEPNVFYSQRQDDLNVLLRACDGLVTMTSTVALQAASVGKPVFTVDLSVFTEDLPLEKMGISKGICSFEAIPDVLDRWANVNCLDSTCVRKKSSSAEMVARVASSLL